MTKNQKEYFDILTNEDYGIMPAPLNDKLAIQILYEYLLGEDFYIPSPLSPEQANLVIVHNILMDYSRRYKKDVKKLG